MSQFIRFTGPEKSESGKTLIWHVVPADRCGHFGQIRWFGRWRRYVFFPEPAMVFDAICLRDIADFCEERTRAHKEGMNGQ